MACWAEPNVAAQSDRFGQTLLTGSPLMEYCGWYAALDSDQADRWTSVSSQLPSLTREQRVERLIDLQVWNGEADFPGWLNRVLEQLQQPN